MDDKVVIILYLKHVQFISNYINLTGFIYVWLTKKASH